MAPRKTTTTRSASKRPRAAKVENPPAMVPSNGAAMPESNGNGFATVTGNDAIVSCEQVRMRAYEIFLARGGAHGHDLADWLRAEMELNAQPDRP
ncbi:MAG TPA: DUF2934 domain-containing protein [Candidatus Binataceae bacterium]|nr:DUF2934 domain-containing protein [Candidatus Binataceae bacterium]